MKSAFIGFLLSNCCLFAQPIDELIGGKEVDKNQYPETVYIQVETNEGKGACTATIIGPEVLLTAGHCTKDQGIVNFFLNGGSYSARCSQAPLYRDQLEDHDMALCKIDKPVKVKPAKVSKVGPNLGDQITLSGYGCIQPGGGQGNDGILRVGSSEVFQLPNGHDDWLYTYGGGAICFGDSGGPSFLKGTHEQIGVNSRGNIQDTSLLTALWIEKSQKFFVEFAETEKVEICGVNKDC